MEVHRYARHPSQESHSVIDTQKVRCYNGRKNSGTEYKCSSQYTRKGESKMSTDANFTHKELCLLLSAICENELGVLVEKSMKDVRKKVDLFKVNPRINVEKINNKQGTTRVSAFVTTYIDGAGLPAKAYTITL